MSAGRVLLLIPSLVALLAGCGKPSPPTVSSPTETSPPWLQDSTEHSRLHFIHRTPAPERFRMPDQMGSGAALLDFDNDGRLDIYLIQNAAPPWVEPTHHSPNQLFHQQPDGTFKNVSPGSGLDVAGPGMGAAVGDVNNDGWPDVLVTEYNRIRLFLNQTNGTFTDITASAGLDNPRWATSAAFFDYDRDGWLDLVVGNYLDYDPTLECLDAQGHPEFCGPHGFPGLVTRLFHNLGRQPNASPRFLDVTVPAGLAHHPGPALGVLCADFNGDHWPDIFLADDGRPNRLFINQTNGTFTEEAAWRGLAFNSMGQTAGDMGIALGDVDGNGLFDLFVTHLAEENHTLWRQSPPGMFLDQTAGAGLTQPGFHGTGFGTTLADLDNNGTLDLAVVNGRVKRSPTTPSPVVPNLDPFWIPYAQPSQLFRNDGNGVFTDISSSNPALCGHALVGRGLAQGDFDNDGGIDLLVTGTGGPVRLYLNTAPNRGHWLLIRATDPALGSRDAYGAEIRVQAGNQTAWRLINPGSGYLTSNDPRAHVGLGKHSSVDSITITWPDGTQEAFPGTTANQILHLSKGTGQALP